MLCLHLFVCIMLPFVWVHGVSTSDRLREAFFDIVNIKTAISSWSADRIQSMNTPLLITMSVIMFEAAIWASTFKVASRLLGFLIKTSSRKLLSSKSLARETASKYSMEVKLTTLCDVTLVNVAEFLTAKDLNICGMVSSQWQNRFGDSAALLWQQIFRRDFGVQEEMNGMVYPYLPLRQYYFQHRLSRFIERAHVYSTQEHRKCIVIYNQVFDITEFIELHPGGHQVLEDVIGHDATALWEAAQHSGDAMMMLTKYAMPDATSAFQTEGNLTPVLTRWKRTKWILQYTRPSSYMRDLMLQFLYR